MYSSPRRGLYGEMPWIGPVNTSSRDLVRRTDVLRAGGLVRLTAFFFLDGRFLLTLFLALVAVFFLLTLFLALAAAFFLLAFFLATFFLVTGRFLLTLFFLLTFFLATFFLVAGRFLLDIFFRVATFLVLTLRFFATFFLDAAFLAATFLREAAAFLRFLLAVFFAGIPYSYRAEKRAGLYIACARMEANFSRFFG